MKLLRTALAVLFLALAAPAFAASIPLLSGPFDPGQGQANFNNLILQINTILAGVLPTTTGSVNSISLGSALTGGIATIGLQSGADANAPIGIDTPGNGNIILFPLNNGNTTGLLQFGNVASFVPTPGLAACPATVANKAPLGMSDRVTGYIIVQDWLGRSHGLPAC